MNVGDTEIVLSILRDAGYAHTKNVDEADIILINTCSVREGAEQRIWGRLGEMKRHKRRGALVGVIGCMAERLRGELIEKGGADIVAGPDSYRDLPRLVRAAGGVNVELSKEETYADISPVRADDNGVSAFIAIMRGCNNFCSYCVVPFTRGRERSRDPQTILNEARELFEKGYREVTLLGQNVNSYCAGTHDFPTLLKAVAEISPLLRVRFATSHPKDLSDKLIETMAAVPNICPSIHLPAQSGSSRMLERMNRKYTREWYLERLAAIRRAMPDCSVTTDLIAGFCGESDDDHRQTLSLMREAGYDFAYMFKYSVRPDTKAAREMADDVPEGVKAARLMEIIALQNELSHESNRRDVGKRFEVLVEGRSKRRADQLTGRTPQNKTVVFDGTAAAGDYVTVEITGCTQATLIGIMIND
jgi:tRNA-2-methylthio-N6-dimethylallyladenosine synthase